MKEKFTLRNWFERLVFRAGFFIGRILGKLKIYTKD
jgi:hypothetical protein